MNPKRFALLVTLALLWLLLGWPDVIAIEGGTVTEGGARTDDGPAPSASPTDPVGSAGRAGGIAGTLTVCPDGPPACDYAVIQEAVDAAAPGDVVKVATGVYTGTQGRLAPSGYDGSSVITQVVYISKSLVIQGGYIPTNWLDPNPIANPTTLDAQSGGRVLFIGGDISPTVEGLRITGGDSDGLGGGWGGLDAGGGVYIITATPNLSGNRVFNNIAGSYGAGMYLNCSSAQIAGNTISANLTVDQNSDGGGMFLYESNATLRENHIAFNESEGGGGVFLYRSDATLSENVIENNLASSSSGGGLFLNWSDAVLSGNILSSNRAARLGGGAYLGIGQTELRDNSIISNTALNGGGGLDLNDSGYELVDNFIAYNTTCSGFYCDHGGGLALHSVRNSVLSGNIIVSNIAENGGGVYLFDVYNTVFDGNTIVSNTAESGGGVYIRSSSIDMLNAIVAYNWAEVSTGGIYIKDYGFSRLMHITVARNSGGDNVGIYVSQYSPSTTWLTNTILVSHSVGIHATAGSTVTLEATLWGNDTDWAGDGTIITGTHNYWGNPAFLDPDAGDYHIGPTSAALDRGISTPVTTDIDGDPRPIGPAPDLGADEYTAALSLTKRAYLPIVQAGDPSTYTLSLTNTGLVTLTATVTDVLPAHVSPGGILTWTLLPLAPGEVWTETVVVTVDWGYSGTLTNVLRATTQEGPSGVYTETTQAQTTPALSLTKRAHPDPVQTGGQLTYTLHLTNTGNVTLTATLTDVLPARVTPGGLLTWTATLPAPGGAWSQEVVVTVEPGYGGTLTNVLRATTQEGPSGVYTETTQVVLAPLDTPVLLYPPDGTITTTQAITLVWAAGDGDPPTGYNLDLDGVIVTTTATTWPALLPVGVHTWTVRAFNAAGYSDWAAPWTVEVTETLPPPGTPVLLWPPDGHITTTQAITLAWQAGPGAPSTGYNLDLDGVVVTTTATTSPTLLSLGVHTWTVRAFNQAGYSAWAAPWTVVVTQTPPCIPVAGVDLTILTPGTVYAGDTVQFSADLAPDDLTLPYTYTVSVDGQTVVPPTPGDDDPLPFSHTFPVTGVYTVEVAAWNCGMDEAGAVTDTVGVEVVERGGYWVYLPVVMRNE